MNKFIAAAALVATLGVAGTAAAQPFAGTGYGAPGYGAPGYGGQGFVRGDRGPVESQRLQARIERGVRSGALTRTEASRLFGQLQDVRRTEWRALRDGFIDRREGAELDRQVANLEIRLRREIRDNDTRGYGSGYGAGYGYGGGYGGWRR